jgi:hypothetical protein
VVKRVREREPPVTFRSTDAPRRERKKHRFHEKFANLTVAISRREMSGVRVFDKQADSSELT